MNVANIYDVAKRAGVSPSTVSRVMGNPPRGSAKTRRRVMAAVEHLRYAPNAAAKNLRMLRSRKLLVTVPDISRPLGILHGDESSPECVRLPHTLVIRSSTAPPSRWT